MRSKRILYILSGNLSTTPRALQSIREASKQYEVTILGVNRSGQWKRFDDKLVEEHRLNYSALSLGRQNFFIWLMVGIIHKTCSFLCRFFKKSIILSAFTSSKVHILLWSHLRFENRRFDLVIGHSGSSLFPTWKFAIKQQIPFMFDVEDHHPAEYIPVDSINEKCRREFLLKKLLPDASFITVASPLIGERIKSLIGERTLKNIVLINNCFPADEFEFIDRGAILTNIQNIVNKSDIDFRLAHLHIGTLAYHKVHFVWFSQNIAANRGLELIIPELAKQKDKIHLHLIGNLYNDFNIQWIKSNQEFISTYPPISQKLLNRFICQFDVGLALELPVVDENRQICLTNKIWAYLQAGLYIMATNTPAQLGFLKEHDGHGVVFNSTQRLKGTEENGEKKVEEVLEYMLKNIDAIRSQKRARFERAKEFAWDKECIELQSIWSAVIKEN